MTPKTPERNGFFSSAQKLKSTMQGLLTAGVLFLLIGEVQAQDESDLTLYYGVFSSISTTIPLTQGVESLKADLGLFINATLRTPKSYHGILTDGNSVLFSNGLLLSKNTDVYAIVGKDLRQPGGYVGIGGEIVVNDKAVFLQVGGGRPYIEETLGVTVGANLFIQGSKKL